MRHPAFIAGAYDIVVNGDHLLSWGVEPSEVQDAALRNLARWSSTAPWTDEVSGERRLISSETGNGRDAARIMLPDVVAHLVAELGSLGRILVGLPERHPATFGKRRSPISPKCAPGPKVRMSRPSFETVACPEWIT
jgi:hypothetical protein